MAKKAKEAWAVADISSRLGLISDLTAVQTPLFPVGKNYRAILYALDAVVSHDDVAGTARTRGHV